MPIAVAAWQLLALAHRELTLFAGFFLCLGMLDDLAVDLAWLVLLVRRRARSLPLPDALTTTGLRGPVAVFIPAWHEELVIDTTVRHVLDAWPQPELRLYVGCYPNDPATIAAVRSGARDDPRVRVVIDDEPGPTTKAACLNRLYRALVEDEARGGRSRAVILHDAEDMVHPAALGLLDAALDSASFVQLPVRPEPVPGSAFVAGHYLDEFTEAHTVGMVVRDALGAALPGAGVGCAIARDLLERLAALRAADPAADPARAGPFTPECLTEDYDLGWRMARLGARARFLRVRAGSDGLVATRAYFPSTLDAAVRQKTRWTHGIAFQGWERLGWNWSLVDRWMALRDRRAPFAALVLLAAYGSLLSGLTLEAAGWAGWSTPPVESRLAAVLAAGATAGLVWRALIRCACTTREYGAAEGLRALMRIPVANIIATAAARRAVTAYIRALRGHAITWDKTMHPAHPAVRLGAE